MARRGPDDGPEGLLVVDKPAGMTSHDVVGRVRRALGTRRVGHAGTLDPDATGVLVLGIGKVTRLLRFVGDGRKQYVGEVALGVETSTLDAAGEVTATHDMAGITLQQVRAAAASFVGDIEQIPPMVSAIRVDGRRLHELAREGIEIERAPRPVTIYDLAIDPVEGEPLVLRITVTCSGGTYIRTLAADIGAALGGGAHLRALRRTAVGPYGLAEAVALDDVTAGHLLPPVEALRGHRILAVDDEVAAKVAVGAVLEREILGAGPVGEDDGPWSVVDGGGTLLAVYEAHKATTAKPAVVLAT